jgi:predicted phage tail protein
MNEVKVSPAPNWAQIFARRPDLEVPGYQEALAHVRAKQPDFEAQRIKEKMQQIHKEKQSTKNRNRSRKK